MGLMLDPKRGNSLAASII